MYLVGQKVICVGSKGFDSRSEFCNCICRVHKILYPPRYNPEYHDFYRSQILYSLEWSKEDNKSIPPPTHFKYFFGTKKNYVSFHPSKSLLQRKINSRMCKRFFVPPGGFFFEGRIFFGRVVTLLFIFCIFSLNFNNKKEGMKNVKRRNVK